MYARAVDVIANSTIFQFNNYYQPHEKVIGSINSVFCAQHRFSLVFVASGSNMNTLNSGLIHIGSNNHYIVLEIIQEVPSVKNGRTTLEPSLPREVEV